MINNEWSLPHNFLTTKISFVICNITKSMTLDSSFSGEWGVDRKSISTLLTVVLSTGMWDVWKKVAEFSGTPDSPETGAANFKVKLKLRTNCMWV